MRIKFVKTKKMPFWKGNVMAGGLWRDGQEQNLPDHVAERLLKLYESPFVRVGEKSISPSSDKMIHQAEKTKEPIADEPEKPLESLRKKTLGRFKKKK